MGSRDGVRWALAGIVCVLVLSAPALWNGFPLLQYDTGGYLARWYEGYLVPSRAVVYGLILNAGSPLDFWPVVILQAALTVWVLALMLRAHGLARPSFLVALTAMLALFTTLPFLTAILLTDIFCGLGVLALYLVVLRPAELARWERGALIVLTAVAAATHSATLAVLAALMLVAVALWIVRLVPWPAARVRDGVLALVLGAGMVFAANFCVSGRLAWTPGGFALSFGRMLQDGIVARYLDDHCPDPRLQLCAYKDQLPDDADKFFWGSPLFDKLGRFAGLGKEMAAITLDSIAAYPAMQAKAAVVAFVRQLIDVRGGEGVLNEVWHTYAIIEKFTPWAVPAMKAARQQHGQIGFDAINAYQYPLALIAMALLPLFLVVPWAPFTALRDLAATAIVALYANAAVCGIFSNPHDRYGARLVWIASLTVMMAALHALAGGPRAAPARR
jgi:hypothetical protein